MHVSYTHFNNDTRVYGFYVSRTAKEKPHKKKPHRIFKEKYYHLFNKQKKTLK